MPLSRKTREVSRRLETLKAANDLVTAAIEKLNHGEKADVKAVFRRSAAALDDANKLIDAVRSQQRGAKPK